MVLWSQECILYIDQLACYGEGKVWWCQEMRSYFAGIDAGTSGAAVIIFDELGRIVSSGFADYSCSYGPSGWVEQDAESLWAGVCEASRQAVTGLPDASSAIRSISVASQRGTFLAVDRSFRPLTSSIVWSDRRAGGETELLRSRIGEERYHLLTGAHLSEIWSCTKIFWLVRHRRELIERTWKLVNGQEWILHNLGASELVTDPSSATMNGMMDIATMRWSEEVLSAIEISAELLPPLAPSMTAVGTVGSTASRATGFATGTPLFVGGGDQQCAAVGAGAVRAGSAELALGTGSVLVTPVDSYSYDSHNSLLYGAHALPSRWELEGISLSAGNSYRWWARTLVEEDGSEEDRKSAFESLDAEAAGVAPGSEGLIFLPFLFGQFVPMYDSDLPGAFLGLRTSHSRKEMTRAVLEGVAFELRMIRDAVCDALGRPLPQITLTGGGSASRVWRGIVASVLGCSIARPTVSECTALGAAALGAVGSGEFSSVEEAVDSMVHFEAPIEPDPASKPAYDGLYELFVEATGALQAGALSNRLRRLTENLTHPFG